jgi:hypothetical protein
MLPTFAEGSGEARRSFSGGGNADPSSSLRITPSEVEG